MQNSQQLYIVLNDDGVGYRIISGQTAIIPGTAYYVTVGIPAFAPTDAVSRIASLHIKDSDGATLSSANLMPHPKDPYGRSVGSLSTDPESYRTLFPGDEDTARAKLVITRESGDIALSSEITIARPVFEDRKPSSDMTWYEAAAAGVTFSDTKEIKSWLAGNFTRLDHLLPQDLPVGCPVHTHSEGSFLVMRKLDTLSAFPADFIPVATAMPVTGYMRVTAKADDGGFEVHRKDVYDGDYVRYGLDYISRASTGSEAKFTFDNEDTGIVTKGFLKSVLAAIPGEPTLSGEVALRIALLEKEVSDLRQELETTRRLTAGTGIYIGSAGEISLAKDVPGALSVINSITDDSTVGDLARVASTAVAASK